MKSELWRVYKLGDKPRRRWTDAVIRWLKENSEKKTLAEDKRHLKWVSPFLQALYLDEITRDALDQVSSKKLETGVMPSTVNRMMEIVRAILNRAEREWEWIDRAPSVRMLKETQRRYRWLTKEEVESLLDELPKHLEAMARFSLGTGLRESNVTGLEWSQVDLDNRKAWIYADQAKAGKSIGVALNKEMIVLLREQVGNHPCFVFTYRGRPVKKCNTKAWRNALTKVGITDFRWHDLRHTWASWHIQQGTPLHILQEMGGWSDIRMIQRYAHLATEHCTQYADKLCEMKVVSGTKLAQDDIRQQKSG